MKIKQIDPHDIVMDDERNIFGVWKSNNGDMVIYPLDEMRCKVAREKKADVSVGWVLIEVE